MGLSWKSFDLVSVVRKQLDKDKEKKARNEAKLRADPAIAARISSYRQRHPHLTAGVMLSAAKAGYAADDPRLDKLGELAYRRRLTKGQGDYQFGDDPSLKDNPRKWFNEVAADSRNLPQTGSVLDSIKPLARATAAVGVTGGEVLGAIARNSARAIEDKDLSRLLNPFQDEKFTAVEAAKGVISGKGAGLGRGFLPSGSSVTAQSEAAAANYSLEYSDQPIFSLPGAQTQPVRRHAGTVGRILFKDILEPGSFWFNAASGTVDAVLAIATDPAAKLSKVAAAKKAASKQFTAEEAGRTASNIKDTPVTQVADDATTPFTSANEDPSLKGLTQAQISDTLRSRHEEEMGIVRGRRNTVHAPTFHNWLTTNTSGKKFTQWAADQTDAYSVWKTLGGEGSQLSPLLARDIADTRSVDEALQVLSPQLGTGIRLKPDVGHFTPVGGTFEGVGIKDNIRSVRLLQQMPRPVIDVDDLPDAATQMVRYARNARLPESSIGKYFDGLTLAETTAERRDVFRNLELAAAQNIATTELTKRGANLSQSMMNRNFNRLLGIYRHDDEIMQTVNKLHASRGTSVDNIVIDGENIGPIRSQYKDEEAISRTYTFANPRDVKKITSTFGRLISHPTLEMPLIGLDHLNNLMKGVNILRPALAPRVHGEEMVRATVAGYDTLFSNPMSYIAVLTGKKGNVNVFGENIDSLDELSKFRKSMAHQADLHGNISAEKREVIPFTDKRFLNAWADDLFNLSDDPVTARIAGRWDEGYPTTGDNVKDTKRWLASDDPDALAFRAENPEVTDDLVSAYVDNLANTLNAKTYNNPELLDAVRTGQYKGENILQLNKAGKPIFTQSFRQHLKGLVDADKSPELTIGDMQVPKNLDDLAGAYRRATDHLFGYLLTKPGNYLNRSPVWKQQYWKSAGTELIQHASPEAQRALIESARNANLGKDAIKALQELAAKASGDLSLTEVDFFANARAAEAVQSLFYNLADRSQVMDTMRLIWPFGEAWKEALTVWGRQVVDHPQIIPRALMSVNGARESGFFYTDPATGEEMFAYPGGAFASSKFFGGMPAPVQAPIASMNMITGGGNPLMPGFGILAQVPAQTLLPDTPKWDGVRELINPYSPRDLDNPFNFLPSWAQHLRNYIGTPANEVQYANTWMDVARYLKSTGKYDTDTIAGMQQLEDRATVIAKRMSLFRGLAQAVLPATPSFQDVAMDEKGHATLAFVLTDRYRQLLEEDRNNDTNLAVTKFIDEFGENNLLYMQSASKGGDVFTKSGYDWVRENQDIAKRYPSIYGLLAPKDGGFDLKAYHALFENGERKPLTPREAIEAAQSRVAKMAYRNAQDKLPEPHKRTKAQKAWLKEVKADLLARYPGFVPEFQGTDIPKTIRDLTEAVSDPRVSKLPVAKAISEYLTARQKVIDQAASRKTPIEGWQTANSTKRQRDWLREVASDITSRYPSFKEINRELFDQELKDDE